MKWIVLEDKQTPETFIAVIGIPESRKHALEHEPCSYFKNKQDALTYAIALKRELNVNEIRVFTPDVH
jgi:hypothetical protein